ncbi:MAG: hypothetical protein GF315_01950 [candidate division Zixibacteria bacterium]|nr:hypothetical protein [candidate division Zixibacteria bacterium]
MSFAINLPNFITVFRLGLVFALAILVYGNTIWERAIAATIAVLVVVGDWLDGHLARKLNQATTLGSVLDIAADRIFESVMWIILADLRLIPVWIPILVISRGILTDSIRAYALRFGYSGFGEKTMQQSRIAKFITGSPFMRSSYAFIKAFTFGWLLFLTVLDKIAVRLPSIPTTWIPAGMEFGFWCAVVAAIMCLVRGAPVVIEGVQLIRQEDDNA